MQTIDTHITETQCSMTIHIQKTQEKQNWEEKEETKHKTNERKIN